MQSETQTVLDAEITAMSPEDNSSVSFQVLQEFLESKTVGKVHK